MQIGVQIQQRRTQNNMSQETLAEKLHISRQSISKWENGTSLPSFANVVAISELFDISLDELIKGDENLMNELEKGPKMNKAAFAVIIGFTLAIVLYIFSTTVLHISEDSMYNWLTLPIFISFFGLIWSIKWKNIDKIVSKWTVPLAIIWITITMIPNIYDLVTGFLDGFNHR
ncbi:helix-turn-helix domain-containing protein [Companilactobacillus jidongensis]|uniref:helix-turn-helix domain-containing protein n=1 Tax=Companilactobacillus jidongensis TaxID=2486006 RepID=UPI000F793D82|nr:helix-turn-helix transcriptional regulator [Companilactobacillus jidongensis]